LCGECILEECHRKKEIAGEWRKCMLCLLGENQCEALFLCEKAIWIRLVVGD
jgi:hypothetical protein